MTLLGEYKLHLTRRGLSPNTITRRLVALRCFDTWLEERSLLQAKREQVETFLDGRNLTARSRYCWLSHLHCFYKWALDEEHGTHDPTARIIRPKLRRTLPRPISEADLAVALECAGSEMAAWLTLAAYAGLRCGEIAALDVDHVMAHEGLLLVRGKGGKERTVPTHPAVLAALEQVPRRRAGPLFVRPRGGRYPASVISRKISVYLEGLGIAATAHQCRHRFATRTYEHSKDIRVVQELLGHSSPEVTSIYVAFSRTEAARAVASLPDVSRQVRLPFAAAGD